MAVVYHDEDKNAFLANFVTFQGNLKVNVRLAACDICLLWNENAIEGNVVLHWLT